MRSKPIQDKKILGSECAIFFVHRLNNPDHFLGGIEDGNTDDATRSVAHFTIDRLVEKRVAVRIVFNVRLFGFGHAVSQSLAGFDNIGAKSFPILGPEYVFLLIQ